MVSSSLVKNTNDGKENRMRLSLTTLLLLLIMIACTSKQSKKKQYPTKGQMLVFDSNSGKYIVSTKDKKLIATWETFREAISNSDYKTLKMLSFDSIYCYQRTLREPIMSADTFYNRYAGKLFTSMSSLLFDSTKIRCTYDLDSSYFYANPVLLTISDKVQPKLAVIFVSFPVSNSSDEGTSGMLGFLETSKGYKFFDYSTIP